MKSSGRQPDYEPSLVNSRHLRAQVPGRVAFTVIERIGGQNGWYFVDWLWQLRGAIDRLFGGPGMRRGRRDALQLAPGDRVDCWRVEAVESGRLLRLVAEMKLPGRAWLQFEVEPDGDGSVIHQTAIFRPTGIAGYLYWYATYPIHQLVFAGMLRRIVAHANRDGGPPIPPDGS